MIQLRDLPERLKAAVLDGEQRTLAREAAAALPALLDVADAAQALVQQHDDETHEPEQSCGDATVNAVRTALAALNKEAK